MLREIRCLTKNTVLTLTLLIFCFAVSAQYFVDFEGVGETNGSYAAATVSLSGLDWEVGPEALIGTATGDIKNGARAARIRNNGSLTMIANKPNGIGTISFFYVRSNFSGDRTGTSPSFVVEYSTNNGTSWIQAGSAISLAGVDVLTSFSATVNVAGDVRARIRQVSGASGKRWNVDDIEITDFVPPCADPTWHYRTTASGLWENGAIWEASPNGSTGWVAANCPPDATAQTVTIRSGHEVNITSTLAIDQTIVEKEASLIWSGGTLNIANGPGDDLTVFGRFVHNLSATAPYSSGAVIRIKEMGVLEVNNNSPGSSHYALSTQIFYEDQAVFYWNVSSSANFPAANQTYFPNAGANEIPIFRTNTPNINVGAGSVTRINGYFEVENNTVTWQNGGAKIFRNGLGGNGNIAQASSSGRFLMDGDTAFIAGSGNINLDGGERLQTVGAVYVKLMNNKTINNGQLRITNPSALDAQAFALAGTGNIQLNSDATLITKHPNGVDGSIGGMAAITYDTQNRQNIIFERNGLQNSGTASLNAILGSVTVRNGSQLTLQQDLSIENSSSGGFLVDGAGSELGTTATVVLNINGNRFFTLQNGASMNNNCLDHLRFETGGNSSTATFSGNGETIKCYNFNSEKADGGVIFQPNSNLNCGNNFQIEYSGGSAVFVDNGNTIEVGDDLRLDGQASNFNFTGTFVLNLNNSGTGNADIERNNGVSNAVINAELNNLIINGTNPDANVRIQGSSGSGTLIIKNNFEILSIGAGRRVRPFANTIDIGGNWINNVGPTAFQHGNETVRFVGVNPQVLTAPNEQHFQNLVIDKFSNDLTIDGEVHVFNNLNLSAGNINTTPSDLIVIRNNATVSNASDVSHVNGPCRKAGNQSFTFPIGKNGLLRPASISNPSNATDHFTAEYFQADPDPLFTRSSLAASLDHVSACEYWMLDRTNGASAVDVTLTWDNATSCGVTMLSDLRVARWNGSQWADEGNGGISGNLNNGSILSASAVTNFSPFTLASSTAENPLPIELLDFSAAVVRNETAVLLEWETASEINNHFFTIERSTDGFNWFEIHEQLGAGNSNSLMRYEHLDENPFLGISYYRLKQTDFDGQFEYFPIRSVRIEQGDVALLYRVNTLGQKVNDSYRGLVILYFSDGSSRKVMQ